MTDLCIQELTRVKEETTMAIAKERQLPTEHLVYGHPIASLGPPLAAKVELDLYEGDIALRGAFRPKNTLFTVLLAFIGER